MKRMLFILLFFGCSGVVRGQKLDSVQIINKAKQYFKDFYVELNFKDPYSYELLKISAEPVSLRKKIEYKISVHSDPLVRIDTTYKYSDFNQAKSHIIELEQKLKKAEDLKLKNPDKFEKKLGWAVKRLDERKSELKGYRDNIELNNKELLTYQNMLNDKSLDFTKTAQWLIHLDCYGANSYGNKILGRYVFRMSLDGKVEGSVTKTN